MLGRRSPAWHRRHSTASGRLHRRPADLPLLGGAHLLHLGVQTGQIPLNLALQHRVSRPTAPAPDRTASDRSPGPAPVPHVRRLMLPRQKALLRRPRTVAGPGVRCPRRPAATLWLIDPQIPADAAGLQVPGPGAWSAVELGFDHPREANVP